MLRPGESCRLPRGKMGTRMLLSVVIPVYNEVESLQPLVDALHTALDAQVIAWEVVFVDDGSTDNSLAYLEGLVQAQPTHCRVIAFRRNYGQTAAIAAGIAHARGDVIALMDADLQNDPADIPLMLARLTDGYDVICGWRLHRQDRLITRRLPSVAANWLIGRVTGVRLHDYGCTLKVFRRDILAGFHLYGEMHRFIPAYAVQEGARILEVPVRHHARRFGTSKYGLGRIRKVLLDLCTVRLLTTYATKPMYLFGGIGARLAGLGVLALIVLFIQPLLPQPLLPTASLLVLAVVLGISGLHALLLGLLAEMLMRTYHACAPQPPYRIRRVLTGETLDDQSLATPHA